MDGDVYVLDEPFLDETGRQVMYPFGFEPTLHRYRYKVLDKLKMGQNIFVGAMGDLFGDFIPDSWIQDVFEICENHPKNNYMFLTKNAIRYADIHLMDGENVYYGTSLITKEDIHKVKFLPESRRRFVSIEPMLEEFSVEEIETIVIHTDWVIIGAETGYRKGKIIPKKEWIDNIVEVASFYDVPVFMKDSLIPVVGKESMKKEFPEQLEKQEMSDKVKMRLFAKCAACGKELRKTKMSTVTLRKKRGGSSKKLCHICDDCLLKFCEEYNLEMPELEEE